MLRKDEKKQSIGRFEATRCKFEKFGQSCRLTGTASPGSGEDARFYCSFHNDVITMSNEMNTFSEFEQWHKDFMKHYLLGTYGKAVYTKDGDFTGYSGGDFHDDNTKRLWRLMGNQ